MKRTLSFTHEQIELITHALGIAEGVYLDIHKEILEKTVHVRGNNNAKAQREDTLRYYDKSVEFVDMILAIEKSEFDV